APARVPRGREPRGVAARAAPRAGTALAEPRAAEGRDGRPRGPGGAVAGAVAAALPARAQAARRDIAVAAVDLRSKVRDVPDFPQPGVVFRDVMPLLADPEALR